ncbi:MAG: hypothetical protein M1818_004602 [Claussenomyces sp. TS43310]|nr:MAG: hypothetical protein M1818_004602 [Claussenomyces sp. TS43310]
MASEVLAISRPRDKDGLVDMEEWLQAEAEAKAEDQLVAEQALSAKKNQGTTTGRAAVEIAAASLQAEIDLDDTNWIGQLLEYRQAHPSLIATTFSELATGPGHQRRFTCTVRLAESARPLGSATLSFATKKAARKHASRCAMTWLRDGGYLAPGSSSATAAAAVPTVYVLGGPRPRTAVAAVAAASSGAVDEAAPAAPMAAIVDDDVATAAASATTAAAAGSGSGTQGSAPTSFAARVAALCVVLGFGPPKYEILADPDMPGMCSGYALFPGDVRVQGCVGVFANVYGKKRAREHCARDVWAFLEGVRRQRLGLSAGEAEVDEGNAHGHSHGDGADRVARVDGSVKRKRSDGLLRDEDGDEGRGKEWLGAGILDALAQEVD